MAAGIGSTIATLLAASGYNLVIAAKTLNDDQQQDAMSSSSTAAASLLAESKHTQAEGKARPSHLQGSLQSVAQAIAAAGHIVHPIKCDVRSADDIQALVQQSLDRFGRIDVLVYNAGAVHWADILNTPTKRYQLMHEVNALGFYTTAQLVLPHMLQQQQGRIIAVSPPIYSRFFKGKTAYAMTKVAMSVLVMGLANELTDTGVTVTALWPATGVQSAVTDYIATDPKLLRKPEIFADACLAILQSDAGAVNGKCLIDEDCLRQLKGQSNFSAYQVKYHSHIMIDMVMCCVLHSIESCSTGGMSRFAFGQLTYPVRNVHVMYNWAAICKSQH
eukprot:jgi/Chrzof1/12787/Cz07g07170.t1